MSIKIIVPSLGESVSEATIAKWYKKPGDSVKIDELIVELETEKVTLEVNAPASGMVENINVSEGSSVTPGMDLGSIKEGAVQDAPAAAKSEPSLASPASAQQHAPNNGTKSDVMSPAASKIAAEKGVSSSEISGSGKDGRITKADVISASPKVSGSSGVNSSRVEERVKMSRLRKTIAQRLKDSQNTAAILTTFNEIDMTNAINLRNKYKEEFQKKNGIKLGFMSFFVKAATKALQEIPAVNAEINGDDIIYRNYCDIGVAVGTDQGLVVPVVRDADKLSFAEVESTIADLGKRAREGKLSMADMTGGTFSITNGGVYGSLMSTPIINPPQAGILGMHATMPRPVAVEGKVEIRPMMYIALSYDHRIIDGKEAVTFLVRIKELVENPERLLLGV
jgi:2-oxoglutarate dehydrogenase E2 component (dihydrolipoamide succinyltransferase)